MPPIPKPAKPGSPAAKKAQRKKLLLLGGAAVAILIFVLIRRSSSTGTVATSDATDPNAIDPTTGLTYAQEAANAAGGLGTVTSGGGTTSGGSTDDTSGLDALSQQFDTLSTYAQGVGAQQTADEQTLATVNAGLQAEISTLSPYPAANTPKTPPKPVSVPKSTATSYPAIPASDYTSKPTASSKPSTPVKTPAKPQPAAAPKTVKPPAAPKRVQPTPTEINKVAKEVK